MHKWYVSFACPATRLRARTNSLVPVAKDDVHLRNMAVISVPFRCKYKGRLDRSFASDDVGASGSRAWENGVC